MKWKHPPIIKIYEALGAVADNRVEISGNIAKVYSSTGNKFYDVSYDSQANAIMSNDNGSYWKGYLGYPAIAYLFKIKTLEYKSEFGDLLKGIHWKDINKKFKNDFNKTFSRDETLAPIFKKWRGMRPGHPSCLYEYLIIGIILQNASVRRSVQMFKALLENYGTLLEFDDKKLWCFWSSGKLQKVSIDELRALKVGYRAKSIKKIDDYFSQGLINETELRAKDRETQMTELLKLYGVGPATVWYLLFDVFHHWDFFNHISPWEQKIYSKLFFDRDPENPVPVKKILKHFDRFGKYKQLAVHYIWEDLFWKRKNEKIPWLEKEIRL
ncbi:MAG: hypothetical protein ABIF06_00195 [bacterium]